MDFHTLEGIPRSDLNLPLEDLQTSLLGYAKTPCLQQRNTLYMPGGGSREGRPQTFQRSSHDDFYVRHVTHTGETEVSWVASHDTQCI